MSWGWAALRRGVRGIVLSMLVLLSTAAHASGEVRPIGAEPTGGGCIGTGPNNDPTDFCGPEGSFNTQCSAYWQWVTGEPTVSGWGLGYGSICFGTGGGSNRVTNSIAENRPVCPADALPSGSTCICRPGTGADPDHAQCVPIISRGLPHDCPICELLAGNPIVPLRGAKKEFVDTGLRIGGMSLKLTYDTTGKLPGVDDEAAVMVNPARALGDLWFSTLHRRLVIQAGGKNVVAQRGDGRAMAFAANGAGGFTAPADSMDRLTPLPGGFRYASALDGSQEDYNELGQIEAIAWADGSTASFTYGGPQTWVKLGGEGSAIGV